MEILEVGCEFPAVTYQLTQPVIAKYKEAVEANLSTTSFVPPLAIAAYAMKAMSQSFSLPPGSVHAAQELKFIKPVAIGSYINCQARVIEKINRARLNMVVIELSTFDQSNEQVLSGKATIILGSSR